MRGTIFVFLVVAASLLAWVLVVTRRVAAREAEVIALQSQVKEITMNWSNSVNEINVLRQSKENELARERKERQQDWADLEKMKKDMEGFARREEQTLDKIYPGLTKYTPGKNEVNLRYLDSFEISKGRIKTFMTNKSESSEKPIFTVVFLTKHGFVTGTFRKAWILDSIGPGQTRIDDDFRPDFRFGEPVYFQVQFDR